MDVDGSSLSQNADGVDQNLLLQFSSMNTSDREDLILQMQKFLGPDLHYNTATFFLDMSNWNVQAAVWLYLEYCPTLTKPTMTALKVENTLIPTVSPGSCFEQSWTLVNSGNDQWPEGCRVIQGGGSDMSYTPVIVPPVSPGATTVVRMKLKAPHSLGISRAFFNLFTQSGEKIGEKLWGIVNVESESTMALTEQLAAMPLPSSKSNEDNPLATSSSHCSSPPDDQDQMC